MARQARRTSGVKQEAEVTAGAVDVAAENTATEAEPVAKQTTRKKAVKVVEAEPEEKRTLAPNTIVVVKSGFCGKLVYKSKKTGEKFVWDGVGAEQDMELSELKSAKSSNKAFFERNWFMVDDEDVLTYLGVGRMYESSLAPYELEELDQFTSEQIKNRIAHLPEGQKETVRRLVKQLVKDRKIDSISIIHDYETALNAKLLEGYGER